MEVTARSRYEQLASDREPYLTRAKECSKYTIPSLIPEVDTEEGDAGRLITPYQSAGSAGVNNLSSKLLLTLFPPDNPFFRLNPSPKVYKDLEKVQDPTDRATTERGLDEGFAKMEDIILRDINTSTDRTTQSESLKHLIVAGNGLFYDGDEGSKFFPLSQYVIARDRAGNVLEIVVKETVSPLTLDADVRSKLSTTYKDDDTEAKIDIYTRVLRQKDKKSWRVYQEVEGNIIPSTEGTYPLNASPWIPLRLIKVSGSAYGRSYVEEYLGDLKSLEALTEAIVIGGAVASKVIFLVNPAGTTDEQDLSDAASGDFVAGNAQDVTTLAVDKARDFQTAGTVIQQLKDSLAHAFLQNSAIQRNGERVTAEEIRYVAGELEDVMGGIYAMLSQEYQLPYVQSKINKLMRKGLIPSVDANLIQPQIITGLDALGRRHDSNRILEFLQMITQTLGPQAISTYCDARQIVHELGVSMGVSQKGIIKSEEQIAQEQQQAQQQQMQQQLLDKGTGPAVNKLGDMMMQQQQMQQAPEEAAAQPMEQGGEVPNAESES